MTGFDSTALDGYIEEVMAEHRIPGIAVVVVDGDEVVYAKGFGFRNSAKHLPVTPETVFGIASVTKSFTALAIMQLVERGKIRLDDPVKQYLPGFNLPGDNGDSVTIYHFLTHTSGLPPIPALNYSIAANTPKDPVEHQKAQDEHSFPRIDTYEDLIDYIRGADFKVLGAPGKYCSYSNDAYALLGAIIAKVTGIPYDRYVWDNILAPLGMNRSTFSVEQLHTMDNVTLLYDRSEKGDVFYAPNWQVAPPYLSCGWLKSSAMDLSNYVRMYIGNGMFRNRQIISPSGIAAMIAPRHEFYGFERGLWYGYGWMVRPNYGGVTLVSHGGNLKGIASKIGFAPERKVGAVVLCNLTRAPASKIWHAAINIALGLRADYVADPFEFKELPRGTLEKFAGCFKSGEGSEVIITVENNQLVANINGTVLPLKTTGSESAVVCMNGEESEVKFLFDEDGNVWAIGLRGRIVRKIQDH